MHLNTPELIKPLQLAVPIPHGPDLRYFHLNKQSAIYERSPEHSQDSVCQAGQVNRAQNVHAIWP
jgi:hypothetical protein